MPPDVVTVNGSPIDRLKMPLNRQPPGSASTGRAAPGFPLAMGMLANAWARMGGRDKAQELLHELGRMSEIRYVAPISLMSVYLGLGELVAAIEQLKMAFDQREWVVPLTVDPSIDPIRGDRRVRALLRRLKAPRGKRDASLTRNAAFSSKTADHAQQGRVKACF